MDQETVGNIVLLVIVTLISVVQNGKGQQVLQARHTQLCVHIYYASISIASLDLSV